MLLQVHALILALGTFSASLAPQGLASAARTSSAGQETRSPIWVDSLEEAQATAALQKRLIMLVFLGERCPKCPVLDNYTFKNPRVTEWMELNVIAVRLFDDVELAERFSVNGVPAIMLLDRNLQEIDRIAEYLEPPELVIALSDIREGRGGLSRVQRELEEKPNDPDVHLRLARLLLKRGRSADASENFLRAFDLLRGDEQREEERLTTILGEIKVLARKVGSASAALRERRDRAMATLYDETPPRPSVAELVLCVREVIQINPAIRDAGQTFQTWDQLRKREGTPPEVVEALFTSAIQARLISERKYEVYLEGVGDPLVALEASLAELQLVKKGMIEAGQPERQIASAGNGVSFAAGWYYEALMGVGREDDAWSVVEMLLALEPSAQAFITMVGAVHRAGHIEEAQALQARARETLPEGREKKRFEQATKRLLARKSL